MLFWGDPTPHDDEFIGIAHKLGTREERENSMARGRGLDKKEVSFRFILG